MITVNDAVERLLNLVQDGHGNLPLIVCDSRSGVLDEACIGLCPDRTTSNEQGWGCDVPEGTSYIAVYVG